MKFTHLTSPIWSLESFTDAQPFEACYGRGFGSLRMPDLLLPHWPTFNHPQWFSSNPEVVFSQQPRLEYDRLNGPCVPLGWSTRIV